VTELVDGLELDERFGPHTVAVRVDGLPVLAERWDTVQPQLGETVCVDVFPAGGSDGAKAGGIVMIVIGIALIWTGFGGYLTTWGAGTALAGGTATGYAAVGIGIAAASALYAGVSSLLTPVPTLPFDGEIPTSNESPAITGTRNRMRLNGPIRRVFGQHRVFPDLGAKPYTEIIGEDQYLRMVLDVGYGPLDISELKVEETAFDTLGLEEGRDYVVHQGLDDDDEDYTLFYQEVDEDRTFSYPLEIPNDTAIVAGTADAHEGSIDFLFPAGLIHYDGDDGTPSTMTVVYTLEYRTAGSSDSWVQLTASDFRPPFNANVSIDSNDRVVIAAQLRGTMLRGIGWVYPTVGHWEVRVTLYSRSPSNGGDEINLANWVVLRTARPLPAQKIANLCQIELRIKSSDQFSGVLDSVNCVADALYPATNPAGGWYDTRTSADLSAGRLVKNRSHSLAFVEVLRGPGNAMPTPESQIDEDSLDAWQTMMDGMGRTFDGVLEAYRTVFDVLKDISGAGRAAFTVVDGRFGVVLNEQKTQIIDHYSHRNTYSFSTEKLFRERPHGTKVTFIDPGAGWQPNTITVYDDGYDEDTATRLSETKLWGITDPDQVYREGRFQLADYILRPRFVTVEVGLRALRVTRGDLVRCSFPVMAIGLIAGRLTDVVTSGGNMLGGTTDELMNFAGAAYAVRVQTRDGKTILGNVVADTGLRNVFTFVDPIPIPGVDPAAGDLFMFGEVAIETGEFIVYEVRHAPRLRAAISLIDHAPAIFTADELPIPPYDPGITNQIPPQIKSPAQPQIDTVWSDEGALQTLSDGTLVPRIALLWRFKNNDVPAAGFQAQIRRAAGSVWLDAGLYDPTLRTGFIGQPVEEGEAYDIRLRAYTTDSRVSGWAMVLNHTVVGQTTPPGPVTNLQRESATRISWEYKYPPLDHLGFRLKVAAGQSTDVNESTDVADGFTTETFIDPTKLFTTMSDFTLFVVAEDRRGYQSTAEAIYMDVGIPAPPNTVVSVAEATGWSGTKVNCTVTSGNLIQDGDTTIFWPAPKQVWRMWRGRLRLFVISPLFWKDGASTFWSGGYKAWSYETGWMVWASSVVDGMLYVDLDFVSGSMQNVTVEVNRRPNGGGSELGWVELQGSMLVSAHWDFKVRISGDENTIGVDLNDMVTAVGKEDTVEYVNDFYLSTGSGRITVQTPYLLVTSVLLTTRQSVNPVVPQLIDRGTPNDGLNPLTGGPLVEIRLTSNGNLAAGNVDVQLRGYT
jgi:predicted phage tail protein